MAPATQGTSTTSCLSQRPPHGQDEAGTSTHITRPRPLGPVRRYIDALAPGSYLALSHWTNEKVPALAAQRVEEVYSRGAQDIYLRPKAGIERFFDGLEIIPPYEGAAPAVVNAGE
jgi:hypothetical protein